MLIGVGSGNPVKREATERTVAGEDGFGDGATVEACPVPSGVSVQPTGISETRRGAVNRARAVLDADRGDPASAGYDLGVGIEGGVAEYDLEGERGAASMRAGSAATRESDDGLFLVMWAAVTDGERLGVGSGPSFVLPESIASRVRAGEELGPVMDDVLGEANVARNQGAAGALTGGRVDRTEALATAVAGALGPFATDLYD